MPTKKPKFVSPVDVEVKKRREQARALRRYKPAADALARLAAKMGGHTWVDATWGNPTIHSFVKINRMGEVAPLLRILAKAGGRKPTVADHPSMGQRWWTAKLEGVTVVIIGEVAEGGRCKFVVDKEETVIIAAQPAQPERTETRQTFKLVCS